MTDLSKDAPGASAICHVVDLMDRPAFVLADDGELLHANSAGSALVGRRPQARRHLARVARGEGGSGPADPQSPLGELDVDVVAADAKRYVLAVVRDRSGVVPNGRWPLSPRERQVAQLVAEGYSTLNIATRLGVGEETVRTLLKRIYRKWNIASRVELARALLS